MCPEQGNFIVNSRLKKPGSLLLYLPVASLNKNHVSLGYATLGGIEIFY